MQFQACYHEKTSLLLRHSTNSCEYVPILFTTGVVLRLRQLTRHQRVMLYTALSQHPEAFWAITGDFNHVNLDSPLPTFHKFVVPPTQGNKTTDLLYANVKDA